MPSTAPTSAAVIRPVANAITWSKALSASRRLPSAAREMAARAAGSTSMPSASAIFLSCSAMARVAIVRNSYTCDREVMVSGILCSSVVAITKTTWGGGSSMDFRRALNDEVESMCTSSMMNTL